MLDDNELRTLINVLRSEPERIGPKAALFLLDQLAQEAFAYKTGRLRLLCFMSPHLNPPDDFDGKDRFIAVMEGREEPWLNYVDFARIDE